MEDFFTSLYDQKDRLRKGIDSESTLSDDKIRSLYAVSVTFKGSQVLLGKCILKDDRLGKWCFPGGSVESKETVYKAATRETFEEVGVKVKARDKAPIVDSSIPKVSFIVCDYVSGEFNTNSEFSEAEWFFVDKLPEDMYAQNLKMLKFINK